MTIADKLQTIADNTQRVFNAGFLEGQEAGGYTEGFDAGKKAEYDRFWDTLQRNGTRENYEYAFSNWHESLFYPKYDIVPTRATYLFDNPDNNEDMTIDLSQRLKDCGVVLDTSRCTVMDAAFLGVRFTKIPKIDARLATSSIDVFRNAFNIVEIEEIVLNEDGSNKLSGWFNYHNALERVSFTGNIGNDIDLRWSHKLSKDSIENIINNAKGGLLDQGTNPYITLSKTAVLAAWGSVDAFEDFLTNDWVYYDPSYVLLV